MKIKLRYLSASGQVRAESDVSIKEIMVNEDFLHPDSEGIAVGFRNKDVSGIIEFSSKEFDHFVSSVQKRTHLVKGVKVFARNDLKTKGLE